MSVAQPALVVLLCMLGNYLVVLPTMFWLKLLLVLCANCARQCSRSVVCLRVAARGPLSDAALSAHCVSSDPAEHEKVGCDCTGLQVQFDCFT